MPDVKCYAAFDATPEFRPHTIPRREVEDDDVEIEIKYAGICGSDVHTAKGEWGPIPYPQVVGHEIAGFVSKVGPKVTKYKVGDRVGVGCFVDSCGECFECKGDEEQFCVKGMTMTYVSPDPKGTTALTQGGYSQSIVVKEHYVLRIPESIPMEQAAPLLCAGITTYAPFTKHGLTKGSKVGVLGLGGLGHMALKLGHAMGCEMVAFSRSEAKREDALALGADAYVTSDDKEYFAKNAKTFDGIINTISANIELEPIVSLIKRNRPLIYLGAPPGPVQVQIMPILQGQVHICGSFIGGIKETQEMLDFCAEHKIGAMVEVIEPSQINEACQRIRKGDVKYRFSIDVSKM